MDQSVFILLFRGINVGGNKIVRMETLRKVLNDSGFRGVATYIQSGNVVLRSNKDEGEIVRVVETVFTKTFGFSSRPTLYSLDAWRRVVDSNPFAEAALDGSRVHAVLLGDAPTEEAFRALRALATTERIEVKDATLYLHTPDGYGGSAVAKALDRVLKVTWTARNWNTVLKLQEMAEHLAIDTTARSTSTRR
jgi:uncharacterized protein (DUF1697 family)